MSWARISWGYEISESRRNTGWTPYLSPRQSFTAVRNVKSIRVTGESQCQILRRSQTNGGSRKADGPDYPPPAPFVPLSATSYQSTLPALFHSFFAARIEAGLGLGDDAFDQVHSQIGPLGQIVIKAPAAPKKKPEIVKKQKAPKVV